MSSNTADVADQWPSVVQTTTEDISPTLKSHNVLVNLYTDYKLNTNPIVNDADYFILKIVLYIIVGIVFGIFGTCTNIINIIVFIKQGLFSGGSTLNLFALALSDLGVSFTLYLCSMVHVVLVMDIPKLPVEPHAILYFVFGWPHGIFTLITRMLTAYAAFERCMCVVIPLKVKNAFSPRKNLVYLLIIVFYGVFSHTPIYIVHYLGEVEEPGTNRTQLDLTFGPDREFWHDLVYYSNSLVLSVLTTVIVIICTVMTNASVQISKEWRKKASSVSNDCKIGTGLEATSSENADKKQSKSTVDKEARLVKIIMTISLIFCICYIPELSLLIIRSIEPRINTGSQYERLSHLIHAVVFHAASLNSGINIFVYYRMSTKYRHIFLSYFRGQKDTS